GYCSAYAAVLLARIQFDDHRLVHVAGDVRAIGNLLEGAAKLAGVDFDPLGEALAGGQVERFADAQLALGLFTDGDDVAGLDVDRRDVGGLAVELDRAVVDQLARFGAGRTKAHAINDVVQARLEQLDEHFAGVAATTLGFGEVLAELFFKNAVHPLELLLFAQLQTVVGSAGARNAAMLAGLGLELAFRVERAAGALQEEVGTLAARELAFRSNITCHGFLLDATTLGRTAAVVRDGRDVRDAGDLDAQRVQGAHRRFAAGAGALDANFECLDAVLLSQAAGRLGSHLSRERRRFA